MEAVLSKLHCRAVHLLSREKSATDFDDTYVCGFKADDKLDGGGSFLEDADSTAAILGENYGSFSRSSSDDVKVIENDALGSSDGVDSLAPPKASCATVVQENSTGFKEVGQQLVDEPTVTEPLAEIQESKPEEKKNFSCDKTTSNQPTADTNRLSRRKPQKTHRILESEERGSAIFRQYLDEDLSDYLSMGPSFTELQSSEFCSGSTFSSSETGSKIDNDNPYADEENIVLPEGTVLVRPEAADSSPQYLETDSSRSKKLFRGNLDSAIIHCTACNRQIGLDGFLDIHRHPVLKVLICRKCYSLYNDLEMEQDAEGSDEQCRWCGQGGDLICCDFCHNALCKGCIRRNLGRKELGSILSADEDVKWKCYVCDPKPLLNLIEHCTSVMEALTKQEKRQQELDNRRKRADARPKAAVNSVASGPENFVHGQPVSVIRAPSVSVMGRSLLKPVGARAESRQKPSVVDVGRTRDVSAFTANAMRSAVRTAPTKNGTIFVALPQPPGAGNLRGLSEVGSKISLLPVNDHSLVKTLDRLLSATHSMGMFLASLKDDLRRVCGTSVVFNTTQMQRRREIASKLWRAYSSYNKSLKEGTIQTGEIVRRTNSATKVLLKTGSSGFQGKAEVIELSDSDEDSGGADRKVSSSLQRVVAVDADSKASVAPQGVAVNDVRRDELVLSSEIKRSVVVNRRKRKQPQHFLSVEEVPEKKSRVDEDPEDAESAAAQNCGAGGPEEPKSDEAKREITTEIRGGVLCVEIGDDLEEVMHKIANGSCSSIELSTKKAANAEVRKKNSEKSGAADGKVCDSRAVSELNGHTSLDSSYRSC